MATEHAEECLTTLRRLKPQLVVRYKVKEIGVFGSLARGEERAHSDVDVLVEFEEGADLLDLVGVGLFLEEELGRKVDVVPRRALRPELQASVLREVVPV